MDNVNWEYEAPKFVDFEANEHLCDNVDEYFDRAHESNSFPEEFGSIEADSSNRLSQTEEKKLQTVHFNDITSQTMNTQEPMSFPQTPSRETYGVKTPSRVLRSGVKQQELRCSTPGLNKDAPSTKFDEISAICHSQGEETSSHILPNVITPSRLHNWNSGAANFNAGRSDPKKNKTKPSLRRNVCRGAQMLSTEPAPVTHSSMPPAKKIKKSTPKLGLTTPTTIIPHSHTKHVRQPTSEERELAQIKKMREDAKQLKKDREGFVKKLEKQTANMSSTSNKSHVTQTKEFHFMTDERVTKIHSMNTRADVSKHSDFQSELRKYVPSPVKKSKTTVVKPFNLSTKRKLPDEKQQEHKEKMPFVPMAKAIMDFHKRTPQRYRLNKGRKIEQLPVKPLKTTIPKTPNITKSKPRVVNVISAEEREEMEVEEMKKHQFKARPASAAILEAPEPIKRVEKKAPTIPVEFHLSATSHASHSNDKLVGEKPKPFKAQPVPVSVFEKPKEKKRSVEVTVPMSPAFALRNRMKAKVVPDLSDSQTNPSFYHPPPDYSNVFKPKLNPNSTAPQPFSFDAKDNKRFLKKKEKIKEFHEKESAPTSFKAQGMPIFDSPTTTLPPKQTKPPTTAVPFQLTCDSRAARRVHEWEKQVEDEVNELREKATFKANKVDFAQDIRCALSKLFVLPCFDSFLHNVQLVFEKLSVNEPYFAVSQFLGTART